MRQVHIAIAALIFGIAATPSTEAAGQTFACTAQKQDAGREEASWEAPLSWWDDSRLRMIDKGSEAYTGDDPGLTDSGWIELFGAQSMRGNSMLGYYRKEHFICKMMQ